MRLSAETLAAAVRCSPSLAETFVDHINEGCALYQIDSVARLAAFLAQIGHESGSLRHTREVWGPTPAQRRYEGRADLGNVHPGDGSRYRGRGLIQTTGRTNYAAVRDRLRARLSGESVPDFEAEPEHLQLPRWAALSAADYWDWRRLNALADTGRTQEFDLITRRVNGGMNGAEDRRNRWDRAKAVLALAADAPLPTPSPAPEIAPAPDPGPAPAPWRSDPIPVDPINAPQGERTMHPAIIPIAIETLKGVVPKLGELFATSDTAKRNVEAAKAVIETASAAVGARNAQEMLETIQADPEAAASARRAIEADWFKVTDMLIKAGDADERSRVAAQDRAVALAGLTGGRWLYLLGGVALLVVIASYLITGLVILGDKETFSDETKAMLLGQVVIFGFVTVLAFLFGSNIQNRMAAQASREK